MKRLETSRSYLEASAFYSKAGLLLGDPSLDVLEVKGGFLNAEGIADARFTWSASWSG